MSENLPINRFGNY